MKSNRYILLCILVITIVMVGCTLEKADSPLPMPTAIPEGILVDRIPDGADVIYVSSRYVLSHPDCLDDKNRSIKNFLQDPDCLARIYDQDRDVLASPRQAYSLDIENDLTIQLTNVDCDFSSLKPISGTKIMAAGMCHDTDEDGLISTNDKPEIHLIDLEFKSVECLTCDLNLRAINNPDYSLENHLFLFSAQWANKFHNYLFTLDLEGNLVQITEDDSFMDFDCSWSEDGKKIVFSRLPDPFFSQPSQVWLMDFIDGRLDQITSGGPNPDGEEAHGPYPIGIDADPDLSPDNSQIVFSRLKTGKGNEPFGIYELVVVDVRSGEITILDSSFANMIPEWKSSGILIIRQVGSLDSLMERKQSIYLYDGDSFLNLEPDFDVFPIGSNGASWVE